MSHTVHTSSIKLILKVSLKCAIFGSFLAGCSDKGNGGNASFTPTVSIVGATCSTDGTILNLTLQNNASYAADFSVGYIFCTSGQASFESSSSPIIPAYGNAIVQITCSGSGSECDGATATPSTVLQCNVSPYAVSEIQSSGFFAATTQLISCAST